MGRITYGNKIQIGIKWHQVFRNYICNVCLILISYYRTFWDLNRAKTPCPPFQLADCLSYLDKDEIEFSSKKLLYFWRPFLAAVRYSLLKKIAFQADWIDGNDSLWLSTLHVVCLILIVCIGVAIVRSIIGTVEVNKICRQLRIVITFPLPILVN